MIRNSSLVKIFIVRNIPFFVRCVFSLAVTFVLFSCIPANAKPMDYERRKPALSVYWGVGLDTYFTHHVTMKGSTPTDQSFSKVSLLPTINTGLTRNYTDKKFMNLDLLIGATYINISSKFVEASGFYAKLRLAFGMEVWNKGLHFFAFVGGVEAVYNDLYNKIDFPVDEYQNLQSNVHFGGHAWIGAMGSFRLSKKQILELTGRIGIGAVGVMFKGVHGYVQPAVLFNPSFSVEYKIMVQDRDYIRFFVDFNAPLLYAVPGYENNKNGAFFNHLSAHVGFGFVADL